MAFTQVLLLQLLLVSTAFASHHMGAKTTFTVRGRNPNGTYTVDFYNKDTFDRCGISLHWSCFGGNCGNAFQISKGVEIDSSPNAPPGERLWCETEGVERRLLPSDKPFQLRARSCCWIQTRNDVHFWNPLTFVDLGIRSDTKEPNRSPDFGFLPFLRVPENCPRTYRLVHFDHDGDKVRCRYGNIKKVECSTCDQPSGFHLNKETCVLQYNRASSNFRIYAFEMVVEDYPRQFVTVTYSDGWRRKRRPWKIKTTTPVPTTATTTWAPTTSTTTVTTTWRSTSTTTTYTTKTTTWRSTSTTTPYSTTTTPWSSTTSTTTPYSTTTTTWRSTSTTTPHTTTTATTPVPTTTTTTKPYPTTTTTTPVPTTTTTSLYPTTTTTTPVPTTTTTTPVPTTTTTTPVPTTTTTTPVLTTTSTPVPTTTSTTWAPTTYTTTPYPTTTTTTPVPTTTSTTWAPTTSTTTPYPTTTTTTPVPTTTTTSLYPTTTTTTPVPTTTSTKPYPTTTTTTPVPTTTTTKPYPTTTTTTPVPTTTTTSLYPTTTTTTPVPTTTTTTPVPTTATTTPVLTTTTTPVPTTTTTTWAPTTSSTTPYTTTTTTWRSTSTTTPYTTKTTTWAPTTSTTTPYTTTTASTPVPTTTTTTWAPTTSTTTPYTTTTTTWRSTSTTTPYTTTTTTWRSTSTTTPYTTTTTTWAPTTSTTTSYTTTTTPWSTTTTTSTPYTTTTTPWSTTTSTTTPYTTTTTPWSTTTSTTTPYTTTTTPWSTTPPLGVRSMPTGKITPFSKLPLHFSLLVDKPAPSCQPGEYLPEYVDPTPKNGAHIHAEVNKEVEIRVKAKTASSVIDNIIFSGPQNTRKQKVSKNEFTITWTPSQEDLGSHHVICYAVEAKAGFRIYQGDMRCVIVDVGRRLINTNVVCTESSMRIEVEKASYPEARVEHLRLSDPSNVACSLKKHTNKTHFIAVTPLNGCGTQIEEDDKYLKFKNELTTFENLKDIVTRKPLLGVQFFCQYPKRGNVTQSYMAHRKSVTVWDKGMGEFTYQFEFFPDVTFKTMMDPNSYPLRYELGDRIYMQIEATTSVSNTVLFVESCRAAPYDNPNYKPVYTIIEDGCAVDQTVQIHSTGHGRQFRFSVEAFKFIGLHDQVYISCSVLMCQAGDTNTRCAKGCINTNANRWRRRKRDVVTESATHRVSQGPLRLVRSADFADSPVMNLNLNMVFIVGCLLAAVGMISGVVLYKAKTSRVKYQPLPTFDN